MSLLSWTERLVNIPEDGLTNEKSATVAELVALAKELGVAELGALTYRYEIRPLVGNRYVVSGKIQASITQSCVVTLDPVTENLELDLNVEFWPSNQIVSLAEEFDEPDREDPEPIENEELDIGRVVFELVSAGINPYPRAPDAELERHSSGTDNAQQEHPFAALAQLRDRPENS